MPEEQQKTGEEDEQVLFASEGTLFQFDDQDSKTWRERGRGELRVNKAHSGAQPQLLCHSSLFVLQSVLCNLRLCAYIASKTSDMQDSSVVDCACSAIWAVHTGECVVLCIAFIWSFISLAMCSPHHSTFCSLQCALVDFKRVTAYGLRRFCASSGQARLVMRQRGNFRLLLNANLWPQMPVSMMDGNKVSCRRFRQMLP